MSMIMFPWQVTTDRIVQMLEKGDHDVITFASSSSVQILSKHCAEHGVSTPK